jgi:hypothetical protein
VRQVDDGEFSMAGGDWAVLYRNDVRFKTARVYAKAFPYKNLEHDLDYRTAGPFFPAALSEREKDHETELEEPWPTAYP